MIPWRCWLTGHVLGGIVARGDSLHVLCTRCQRVSPGVRLHPRDDRGRVLAWIVSLAWLRALLR